MDAVESLVSLDQAAKRLGMSTAFLRKAVARGQLKPVRLGRLSGFGYGTWKLWLPMGWHPSKGNEVEREGHLARWRAGQGGLREGVQGWLFLSAPSWQERRPRGSAATEHPLGRRVQRGKLTRAPGGPSQHPRGPGNPLYGPRGAP
jgi:hypothetical protein